MGLIKDKFSEEGKALILCTYNISICERFHSMRVIGGKQADVTIC